jgi:mannose-6-phosphate isomerase-like protein (cupin superfamily)
VKQGQQISNPRTGQRMTIISADRAELRLDTLNPPTAVREPMHVHPRQESGAEVLTGSLIFEVAGERRRIAAGEKIAIAANTPHRFWNEGPDDARAVQFFRPALDSAAFFETLFALAQTGQLASSGMPKPLALIAMVPEFGEEIRPTSPPWPVLQVVARVLGPIARARGYQGRLSLPAGVR